MVNSRQKGNKGEQQVMSLLGRMTEEKDGNKHLGQVVAK